MPPARRLGIPSSHKSDLPKPAGTVKVLAPAAPGVVVGCGRERTLDHYPMSAAAMKLVAAEDLAARNTLDEPQAIQPVTGTVEVTENTVTFQLPRWSAAVIEVRRR